MATSLWARVTCGAALSFLTLFPGQPARADSLPDLQMLVQALAAFGTRVVPAECKQEGLQGYYEPANDQIVLCTDSLTDADPASVWDVLAHEATHKMQACVKGSLMPPTHVGRMMRQLRATYPETLADLNAYASGQSRAELEARWMELQPPEFVIQLLVAACQRP
jgi:antirestriction protein ArdC